MIDVTVLISRSPIRHSPVLNFDSVDHILSSYIHLSTQRPVSDGTQSPHHTTVSTASNE